MLWFHYCDAAAQYAEQASESLHLWRADRLKSRTKPRSQQRSRPFLVCWFLRLRIGIEALGLQITLPCCPGQPPEASRP